MKENNEYVSTHTNQITQSFSSSTSKTDNNISNCQKEKIKQFECVATYDTIDRMFIVSFNRISLQFHRFIFFFSYWIIYMMQTSFIWTVVLHFWINYEFFVGSNEKKKKKKKIHSKNISKQ